MISPICRFNKRLENNRSQLTNLIFKPNETEWHYMNFSKIKTLFVFLLNLDITPINVSDHFA